MKKICDTIKEIKPCYYLTEEGEVFNATTGKYLKMDDTTYRLSNTAGNARYYNVRTLYELVYN